MRNRQPEKKKPKRSIHDYKPKNDTLVRKEKKSKLKDCF